MIGAGDSPGRVHTATANKGCHSHNLHFRNFLIVVASNEDHSTFDEPFSRLQVRRLHHLASRISQGGVRFSLRLSCGISDSSHANSIFNLRLYQAPRNTKGTKLVGSPSHWYILQRTLRSCRSVSTARPKPRVVFYEGQNHTTPSMTAAAYRLAKQHMMPDLPKNQQHPMKRTRDRKDVAQSKTWKNLAVRAEAPDYD